MSVDGKKLRAYIEQYESREDARAAALEDMRQLLKDADKNDGINAKVLRRLIKELRKPRAEVAAEETLLQEYRDAYLSFESTPLGQAASFGAEAHAGVGAGRAAAIDGEILEAIRAEAERVATVKSKVTRIFAEAKDG